MSWNVDVGRLVNALAQRSLLVLAAAGSGLVNDAAAQGETGAHLAVLVEVHGTVRVLPASGAEATVAKIATLLRVGDTVEPGPDSWARIYIKGGVLLRVEGRTNIDWDLAPTEGGGGTLPAPAIEILENGLWVLGSTQGSVIMGPLRGDEKRGGGRGIVALAPRGETVLSSVPTFYWSGGSSSVQVVVERDGTTWRSEPVDGEFLDYPGEAPELQGTDLRWWLESTQGKRLTARVPFDIAPDDVQENARAFQRYMRELERAEDDGSVVALVSCAFFQELQAWSAVLEASVDLLSGDAGGREIGERAADMSRRRMSLNEDEARRLLELRARSRRDGATSRQR